MSSPTLIPRLWSFFVRFGVFLVLEGAAARLAERNALPGRANGAELLLGLLALISVPLWPAVGALGARAVLAAHGDRWNLLPALGRSMRGCLAVLPYLGAPLVALMLHDPRLAPRLAALAAAYLAVAAGVGCLLARGAAPWGEQAAMRFVLRFGALFALVVVFTLRAWQPELTLAPLFETTLTLRFPFEKERSVAPPPARHARPEHPVPPLAATHQALGMMLGMASITLLATAVLWRRAPAAARPEPRAVREPTEPQDIWPTIIVFAGALALLVFNAALLPRLTPRPRAYTVAGEEVLLLAAIALAIRELSASCRGSSFWPAAGAVTCLAAAAVLGLEEAWIHHLPTTVALLFSVVAFAALAASASRALEETLEPPTAWALWLGGGSLVAVALVITDALYLKLDFHEVQTIWQFFLACWLVTKTTLTVLILFIAVVLPQWMKPVLIPSPSPSAQEPRS